MLNFLARLFAPKKPSSRSCANDRLRVVLSHDRVGSSAQLMDTLKEEIIEVIARHVEIDGSPEVHFITEGRQTALDISIPIKGR